MKLSMRTYAAYSIACIFIWAVLLAVVESFDNHATKHTVQLVFLGWAIGWVSATIARAVYPPRKSGGPVAESAPEPSHSVEGVLPPV
jgi:hypothetical protein